jgi:hypothetical protein
MPACQVPPAVNVVGRQLVACALYNPEGDRVPA